MKLTAAQQKIIDQAKADIDRARAYDFPEYMRALYGDIFNEERLRRMISTPCWKQFWKDERRGIVETYRVNTRSLKKLEELGLIEIIIDSTGKRLGVDTIKLLNY